jgi:hypothetical protein
MKLRKFMMNDTDNMEDDEEYQRAVEEAQMNPTNAKAAARLAEAEKKRKKRMLEEAGKI